MTNHILTLRCDNRPGIVAAVATRLAENGGDITEAAQFDDPLTGKFFMRVAFAMDRPVAAFERGFAGEVERLRLDWTLREAGQPRRVLILVSSFDHCLVDLLYRQRIGELDMEVVGIVSNHPRTTLARSEFAAIPTTISRSPRQRSRSRRRGYGSWSRRRTPSLWCWRATCRCCRTSSPDGWPGAASTSTTASCRGSRAPSHITRRMSAGSR
jgi:formyltetrahydrofolate hydrolase